MVLALLVPVMFAATTMDRPNAIGASVDVGSRSQRDENFNRTRYDGVLGHLRLHYDRIAERDRHTLWLGGGAGMGWNRHDKSLLWIDLGLRYGYRHVVAGDTLRLWLGGSIGGGPTLFQFRDEDADHVNWTTAYDLALRISTDWSARDRKDRAHTLEVAVELPVLGIVSRPPRDVTYNNDEPGLGYLLGRAHRHPRFASWHNVQRVVAGVSWALRLRPGLEQRVGLETDYRRVSYPREIVTWSHRLVYRLDFRVGGPRK